jgi:uncharacterized membrane protein YgcG
MPPLATKYAPLAFAAGLTAVVAATTVPALLRPRGDATSAPTFVVPPSPAPHGFVHDGGPVLSPAGRQALDAHIRDVQRTTGGDVGVAVLRDLAGRAPSDAGLAIYRAWKVGAVDSIGSPYRDLGALLLVVPKELAPDGRGECWITTGLGAEGVLTDARAGSICRDVVVPHLRRRDHAAALTAGVDAIAETFAEAGAVADSVQDADEQAPADTASMGTGDVVSDATRDPAPDPALDEIPEVAGAPPTFSDAAELPWVLWLAKRFLLVGAAIVGVVLLAHRARRDRPRRCPAGPGRMTRLDEVADDAALADAQRFEERLASVDYDVWTCARCPERIVVGHRRWFSGHEHCTKCEARTLRRQVRTVRTATTTRTGLEEHALHCLHCGHTATQRRTIPRRSSSSGGSRSGGGSSSSFGGSGRSSGGGGGSSY